MAEGHLCCSGENDRSAFLEHGVQDDEELSGDGDEDCLWGFAFLAHSFAQGDESGDVSRGGEGCDVEGLADLSSPSPDPTSAAPGSALAGMGCETGEGGDALSTQGAEFRQLAEKRGEDGRANAGNGSEQASLACQPVIFRDEAGDAAIEVRDLLAEEIDHGFDGGRDLVLSGAVPMQLLGLSHIDQLSAATQEIGETRARHSPER